MGIASNYRGPSGEILPGTKLEKRAIEQHLRKLFEEKEVLLGYLFGSFAKGEESPSSDIDIAVLLLEENPSLFQELVVGIRKTLGTERFELVILNQVPPLFAFEVVAEGVVVYARDEETLNDFEMNTIRKFQDTAYLRKVQNEYLRQRAREWYSKKKASLSD